MLLNTERSRQICSERADLAKLVGGRYIALFRYLIHELILPEITDSFPFSPHVRRCNLQIFCSLFIEGRSNKARE